MVEQSANRADNFHGAGVRFKPGQSGNPAGRPKNTLTSLLRHIVDADNEQKKRALVEELVRLATSTGVKGQIPALMEIFDRLDGKVPSHVSFEGQLAVGTPEQMVLANRKRAEIEAKEAQLLKEGNATE